MTLREKLRRFYREMLSKLDIQNTFGDIQHGERHGPWEEYWHGSLWEICTYRYGRFIGPRIRYHQNGQVASECIFNIDGKKEGEEIDYYENGQLRERCSYKEGVLFGPYELYYENGQLKEKGTYNENGNPDDMWVRYHENGRLHQKCFYKNGSLDGEVESYDFNGNRVGEFPDEYLAIWEEKHKQSDWAIQLSAEINQKEEMRKQQAVKSLKEQLEKATDPEEISKVVGPARTPERKVYAERIVKTRRVRDILATAAHKAKAGGDESSLHEIMELARPYAGRYAAMADKARRKRLQRKAKSGRE